MERTTRTVLKLTKDELNNTLMTALQKSLDVRIEKITINEGIVTIEGMEEREHSKLNYNSEKKFDLLESIAPNSSEEDKKNQSKYSGFSKHIKELFQDFDQIPADKLFEEVKKKYDIPRWRFNVNVKNACIEISPGILALKSKTGKEETLLKTA